VLAGIIGERKRQSEISEDGIDPKDITKPSSIVTEIEFGGLSLRKFIGKDANKSPQDEAVVTVRNGNGVHCTF
jgi:hypothetical protein